MTNLNRVAMYCVDNPEHPMFRETDGARCVECNSLVSIKPVTEAQYYGLPTYQQLRDQRKPKTKQSLSISVDMDTDKMQLKLRAIAKHAEKLADELAAIDNAWQCDCGSFKYEDSFLYAGNDEEEPHSSSRQCREYGEYYAIPSEPTVSDA